MKLKILLSPFIILKCLPALCQQQDTIQLFYKIGQKELSVANKAKLDSLNSLLIDTSKVYIFGFADYLGHRGPNYFLSKHRAETVKDYLLNLHGKNIFIADGKGQVNPATKNVSALGDPLNRRVDIIVTPSLKGNKKVNHPLKTAGPVLKKKDSVYKRINNLATLNVGESVSLKELTFLPGRHLLEPEAIPILKTLTAYLKTHKKLIIEIQGHVCCIPANQDGFDSDSQQNNLSLTRAKFVFDYLVSKGIKANRMRYKGLGGADPKVSPELTAEDQAQNRRVVIVLLHK